MANFDCSYCGIFCHKEILLLFKMMVDKDLEARAQRRSKQKNLNSLTKFPELKIIGDWENICGSIYAWSDGSLPLGRLCPMVTAGNKIVTSTLGQNQHTFSHVLFWRNVRHWLLNLKFTQLSFSFPCPWQEWINVIMLK